MAVDTAKLTEPFPPSAIKSRQGGGNKALSYVEGHTVIHRLIAATDNQWSFRVVKIDTRDITTQRGAATLVMATVELEIPGLGARQHIGVQMVNDAGGEDLVKGAITDALKKAATLFGVGLELYGPDYESGEVAAPVNVRSARGPRYDAPLGNDARPHEPSSAMDQRPAPARGNSGGTRLITPSQVKFIRDLLASTNRSEDDLCARYQVQALEQLSAPSASEIIDQLKAERKPRAINSAPRVDRSTGEVQDDPDFDDVPF